jgi:hypothetical protein
MPTLQTWDFEAPTQILILDEVHLPTLIAQRPTFLDTVSKQSIVILCANARRQAALSQDIASGHVELLSKPFGPFKLAKTICRALEKAATARTRTEMVGVPTLKTPGDPHQGQRITPTAMIQRGNRISESTSSVASPAMLSPVRERPGVPPRPRIVRQSSHMLSIPRHVVKDVRPGPDGGYPFPQSPTRERTPAISDKGGFPFSGKSGNSEESTPSDVWATPPNIPYVCAILKLIGRPLGY